IPFRQSREVVFACPLAEHQNPGRRCTPLLEARFFPQPYGSWPSRTNTGCVSPCLLQYRRLRSSSLNDHTRPQLVGNNKVRCLVKIWYALGSLRLAVCHTLPCQHILNGTLHHVTDQLRYRVTMAGKRPTKTAVVSKHWIRH